VKGSRFGTIVGTVIVVLIVLAGLGLAFMYSGIYDVAASKPPSGLERWVANTVRGHSIERRAEDLTVPDLEDSARVMRGLVHYRDDCAVCHGVPGEGRAEFASDMHPRPPRFFRTPEELARRQERMQQAEGQELTQAERERREQHEREEMRENFWIVKHGVAMTAMPAFGDEHSDDAIWDLLAFVERVHSLTAEEYRDMVASLPDSLVEEHEHEHPEAGAEEAAPGGDTAEAGEASSGASSGG